MKKPKGLFTYYQHAKVIDEFTDEEAGKLYKALLRYGLTQELPEFDSDRTLRVVFGILKSDIDENCERYRKVCENRQKAAMERERRKACAQGSDDPSEWHNCDNSD